MEWKLFSGIEEMLSLKDKLNPLKTNQQSEFESFISYILGIINKQH